MRDIAFNAVLNEVDSFSEHIERGIQACDEGKGVEHELIELD